MCSISLVRILRPPSPTPPPPPPPSPTPPPPSIAGPLPAAGTCRARAARGGWERAAARDRPLGTVCAEESSGPRLRADSAALPRPAPRQVPSGLPPSRGSGGPRLCFCSRDLRQRCGSWVLHPPSSHSSAKCAHGVILHACPNVTQHEGRPPPQPAASSSPSASVLFPGGGCGGGCRATTKGKEHHHEEHCSLDSLAAGHCPAPPFRILCTICTMA